ncbi:hypothetical protein [Pseudomonas ovata]|uniref:hypothetical protein n=1 Tax=Pseudomonas ovata TaxID=1839709 RepID=UPI000D686BE5|nr:hypothetical protein [Pseudomonas ovata]
MFSKITRILLLSASLLVAGTAGAADRHLDAPVFAGASVDAAPATLLARNDRYDDRHHYRRPAPREYRNHYYAPPRSHYQHRRYAPPPRHHYREHNRHDRRYYYDRRRG